MDQDVQADRDANVAGRDLTIYNYRSGNRAAVPHPATVPLPGRVTSRLRPHKRLFEGRAEELDALGRALGAQGGVVAAQAVYGLGGVGKSELALQYAQAHRRDYDLVWWITAAGAEKVEAGLTTLAEALCPMLATSGMTAYDKAAWATGWLQSHERWLLILDNVEDLADIELLLGQLEGGHVIVTSRRDADWGRFIDPVPLDLLSSDAATQLLIRRTRQDDAVGAEAAARIAAELGFLPLALEQAAAYIVQTRMPVAVYLDQLRQDPGGMRAAGTSEQQTIARLWDLHITAIRDRSPAAARLLGVLAHYAPDAIPRAMLGGKAVRKDTDEALGLLASYSMITLTPDSVTIHRLLQAVILTRLGDAPDAARSLRDTALDWLDAAIPSDPETNVAAWLRFRALVPQAEALARHFPQGQQPEALGRVQDQLGSFLDSQGAYAPALAMQQSALDIIEAALGAGHPDTITRLGNLAATYWNLGRFTEALALEERALAIIETASGPDDLDTAVALDNLAMIYSDLDRPADALPLRVRALAITEAALGPDHSETAPRLNNLIATYSDLGQPADALPLRERALAIAEKTLGPEHPDTVFQRNSLAAAYSHQGRHSDALPHRLWALATTEAAQGPDHPDTAIALDNLATTYSDLGRPADALPLRVRALAIIEAALGPGHPATATRLDRLATTYHDLERHSDALPLEERARQIRRRPH